MSDRRREEATIITVDVEEWFHGHNYLSKVPPKDWEGQRTRVVEGTRACLDLLDRHGVKATFFVLGWTARRQPDLVRRIADSGHEIGCHSFAHPEVFRMSRSGFRDDCEQALEALATAGIEAPAGYRAPSFSITPAVHDYLEVLQELGFRYDCSLFPVHHPRYGQPDSPRRPFAIGPEEGDLVVVPMPTWRIFGVNVPFSGGGYLRLLPWWGFRMLRGAARRQGIPCIVYTHPWELDDFRPSVGQNTLTKLRSQGGQASMPRKLERILAAGNCETLGAYVESLRSGGGLPVREPVPR